MEDLEEADQVGAVGQEELVDFEGEGVAHWGKPVFQMEVVVASVSTYIQRRRRKRSQGTMACRENNWIPISTQLGQGDCSKGKWPDPKMSTSYEKLFCRGKLLSAGAERKDEGDLLDRVVSGRNRLKRRTGTAG